MFTILMDVDGVVADFLDATRFVLDKDLDWELTSYSFEAGLPPAEAEMVRTAMAAEPFWQQIRVMPGAKDGIDNLRRLGRIIWVTTPYEPCPTWCHLRREWLNEHFSIDKKREPLVFTKHKELVRGTVLIDDNPLTLSYDSPTYRYLFRAPWNKTEQKSAVWSPRAVSWLDVYERLKAHQSILMHRRLHGR